MPVEPGFVVVGGGSTWGGFGYETSLEEEEYLRMLQDDLCKEEVMMLIDRGDYEDDLRRSFTEGRRGIWKQFCTDLPRQDLTIGEWRARGARRGDVVARLIDLVREVKHAREGREPPPPQTPGTTTPESCDPNAPADAPAPRLGLLGTVLEELGRYIHHPAARDVPHAPAPTDRVKAAWQHRHVPPPAAAAPTFRPPLPFMPPTAPCPREVLTFRVVAVCRPPTAASAGRPCAPLDEVMSVSEDGLSPVSLGKSSARNTAATPMCLQTVPSQVSMTSWDDLAESPRTTASSRRVFSPAASHCADPLPAEHNLIRSGSDVDAAKLPHRTHMRRMLSSSGLAARYSAGAGCAHSAAVFKTLSRIAAPRLAAPGAGGGGAEWLDDAPVVSLANYDVMDKVDILAMFCQQGVIAQGFGLANRHYAHVQFGVHVSDGPQHGPLSIAIKRGRNEAGAHDVMVTVRKYFQLFRLDDECNSQNLGTVRVELKLPLFGQEQVHLSVQGVVGCDAEGDAAIAASSC